MLSSAGNEILSSRVPGVDLTETPLVKRLAKRVQFTLKPPDRLKRLVVRVAKRLNKRIDLLFGQSGIKILHAFFQGRWHPGDHGPPKKGDCFRGCDRANRWFK
ncbi:hypothetical protein D9M71_641660 [compost metagenome]